MNSSILALRAISGIFFQKLFKPIAWVIGVVLVLLLVGILLLGFLVSSWWFIALIILAPFIIALTAIGAALWYLSERILPRKLGSGEKQHLNSFTDKLFRVAEVRATPPFLMIFMVGKDILRGKKSNYVEDIVNDTTSLRSDFMNIRELFETKHLN